MADEVEVGLGEGTAALAEALRRHVHRSLRTKDLNSILATAGEVATTRSGDCTEHAVVLAALLRAREIPSRVVTGLVYVEHFAGEDDVWSYHMWTQGWLEGPAGGRWVDLDATLDARPMDAAHVALGVSALEDERAVLLELGRITPLLGRLSIEWLDP
jgi:transglutaminase-like putative cysteine protease